MSAQNKKHPMARKNTSLVSVYANTVIFFDRYSDKFPIQLSKDYLIQNYDVDVASPYYPKASVEITKEDSFDMAERFVTDGLNPLVLNFASNFCPGGGVKKGATAQEEDLFRRSNYYQTLNKENVVYPLNGRGIYSPTVYVARDSGSYDWKKSAFRVSCFAIAAVREPEIFIDSEGKERFAKLTDKEYTRNAVKTIFHATLSEGHKSLVLGAWGCGAFRGPRDDIAEIFAEILSIYSHRFERIGFGILVRNAKDQRNFDTFKSVLGNL